MPVQLLTIARNAFVESLRQPIMFVLIMASGLLQILNTWGTNFSMGMESATEVKGDDKLLLDIGLATVFGCGTLLAGFLATAVLSREIENKTVLTVISKPVSRTTLILGKYLGVTGSILAAVVIMLAFLLFGIRHGVMATAAHELDGPVLVYSLSAVLLALVLGGWCNYFYGWSFPQTFVCVLLPAILVAFVLMLGTDKKWKFQPLAHDFHPQVMLACVCLGMAILVLTAVAIAASTRLSQVMTITVCFGVFVLALLSNFLVGRHVFKATSIGVIAETAIEDPNKSNFREPGSVLELTLEQPAKLPVKVGDAIYISPSPNGFPNLVSESYSDFSGPMSDANATLGPGAPSGLILSEGGGSKLKLRHQGATPVTMTRPPEKGDYLFLEPVHINLPALAVWGVVPNLQYFWLLDPISQGRRVPIEYVGLVGLYSLSQIGAFLSLAVVLFQRRDLG
jgi:ABC-type transport system involved in multi-copper enzyme maturation permease subunit